MLPEGYRDPTPVECAAAEVIAATAALAAWTASMLSAINVEVDLPLDDPAIVAQLGPVLPDWLADGIARAQALTSLGPLMTEGT